MFYCDGCPEAQKYLDNNVKEINKYDWNLGKELRHKCGKITKHIVDWPSDNKQHPFNLLKDEGQLVETIFIPQLKKEL